MPPKNEIMIMTDLVVSRKLAYVTLTPQTLYQLDNETFQLIVFITLTSY
mgnify:CR=1 FL=1